jgi:hypothetical protein
LNENRAGAVKCKVYTNGILIGSVELLTAEPPMGIARGEFLPNGAYNEIQPVVREYFDTPPGEADTQKGIERQAKYDALRLSVITENGEVLDSDGVAIFDCSEKLDTDPYELHVLGIPSEVYNRLFR